MIYIVVLCAVCFLIYKKRKIIKLKKYKLLVSVTKYYLQKKISYLKSILSGYCITYSDNYAIITTRGSKKIYIPYNILKKYEMNRLKVNLVTSDGIYVDITQQCGIPYMLTAHQLGGTHIKIENNTSGISKIYSAHETPMYADDVEYIE